MKIQSNLTFLSAYLQGKNVTFEPIYSFLKGDVCFFTQIVRNFSGTHSLSPFMTFFCLRIPYFNEFSRRGGEMVALKRFKVDVKRRKYKFARMHSGMLLNIDGHTTMHKSI